MRWIILDSIQINLGELCPNINPNSRHTTLTSSKQSICNAVLNVISFFYNIMVFDKECPFAQCTNLTISRNIRDLECLFFPSRLTYNIYLQFVWNIVFQLIPSFTLYNIIIPFVKSIWGKILMGLNLNIVQFAFQFFYWWWLEWYSWFANSWDNSNLYY